MFNLIHALMVRYSTVQNGLALYTEKSQTLKMIKLHFHPLYSLMSGSKTFAGSQLKV